MKLRIRGNTLRLRLTRSEVDLVAQGEVVAEVTQFPDGSQLRYELVPGHQEEVAQTANDEGTTISVEVPKGRAATWAESDEVGFSGDDPFQIGFACGANREGLYLYYATGRGRRTRHLS